MLEVWADVVGYEGRYKVSNCGGVLSLNFNKTGQVRAMRPQIDKDGYVRVGMCGVGKQKYLPVHRLVALAFIPNPDGLEVVNHLDGKKTNNQASNLEWTTAVKNSNHAKAAGLYRTCADHPSAKLTWADVAGIRQSLGLSLPELASKYKVSRSAIWSVLKGKTWKTPPTTAYLPG